MSTEADSTAASQTVPPGLSELLRKEADHRIGNSLQLISSLLNLQQSRIVDAQARNAIARAGRRLRLVAQLHQRLSQGNGSDLVPLEDYLASLRDEIFAAVVDHHRHALLVNVDAIWVPANIASAIGMIVNEFIFNSLKHGYPDQACGTIEIACGKDADGRLQLNVSDDGVGLPDGFELPKASGLGMKLMQGLVAQLGGSFTVKSDRPGTRYEITLPLPRP